METQKTVIIITDNESFFKNFSKGKSICLLINDINIKDILDEEKKVIFSIENEVLKNTIIDDLKINQFEETEYYNLEEVELFYVTFSEGLITYIGLDFLF